MERVLAALTAACDDADAIVYGPLGFVGFHVGQARGVPTALAQLQPTEPTRAFPSFTLPARSLGPLGNKLSHRLLEQVGWQLLRRPINRWRHERLGLSPLPLAGPWPILRRGANPVLYAYSPTVLPRPVDWPPHVHVTGYWFLDRSPAGRHQTTWPASWPPARPRCTSALAAWSGATRPGPGRRSGRRWARPESGR